MYRSVLFYVLPFLALIGQFLADAQTLSVFQPNPSLFPQMSANIYVLDANGKRVPLNINDISVREDGVPRNTITLTCPPEQPQRPISSVLCIDASSSMRSQSGRNFTIATSAATAWLQGFDFGSGECAITSFNSVASIQTDFTNNPTALQQAISDISTADGTDYNAAFLQSGTGALHIVQNARRNKVIVLLTDGLPATTTRTQEIITRANQLGCRVYCISVGFSLPPELSTISSATNGLSFGNVSSTKEAENIYRIILAREQNIVPCLLSWQSCYENNDAERVATIRYQNSLQQDLRYTIPQESTARITLQPQSVHFDAPIAGIKRDTTIVLKVTNTALTVTTISSTNSAFSISPSAFTVNSGDSIQLTLSYTPIDDRYSSSIFDISTSLCSSLPFVVSSGKRGVEPQTPTIRLISPNGGERFSGGDTTLIQWNGILPSDNVQLDLSTDNGSRWVVVTSEATNSSYTWLVPNVATNRARIRVSQISAGSSLPLDTRSIPHASTPVVYTEFSPDGQEFLTCADSSVYLWDTRTGALVRRIALKTKKSVVQARYSYNGNRIFICTSDKNLRVWDRITQQLQKVELDYLQESISAEFSTDDEFIALASIQNLASSIAVLRSSTLEQIFEVNSTRHNQSSFNALWLNKKNTRLFTHSIERRLQSWNLDDSTIIWSVNGVRSADIDRQHSIIAYSTTSNIAIHDVERDSIIRRIPSNRPIDIVAIAKDASIVACFSNDALVANRVINLYNTQTGELISSLPNKQVITQLRFSSDNTILAAVTVNNSVQLYDVRAGIITRILSGHRNKITAVDLTVDGESIITSSYDYTARLTKRQPTILQSDTSDQVFTIAQSATTVEQVIMDDTDIGRTSETVVSHITNTGTDSLTISGVTFEGNDAGAFSIMSGLPIRIASGTTASVEYRFRPTEARSYSAALHVLAQHTTITTTIMGNGRNPEFRTGITTLDFGTIQVGTTQDSVRACVLKNVSSSPLTVDSVQLIGRMANQYTVIGFTTPSIIPANDSLVLHLRCAPTRQGRTSSELRIHHHFATKLPNTTDIVVTGRGIQPGAAISSSVPQFSRSGCASVIYDTVVITNTGTALLRITSASFTGVNRSDFDLNSAFVPLAIDTGKSAKIVIRCTPSSSGLVTATLVLDNNSIETPKFNIELQAKTLRTGFTVDSSIDVGVLCPGIPVPLSIQVKNTGDATNRYLIIGSSFESLPPVSIDANQTQVLTPKLLARENDGLFSTVLLLRDELCNVTKQVNVRGTVIREKFTVPDKRINGQRGTTILDSITIINTSQRTLSFSSLPDISPMTFVSPQLPLVIPPSSQRSLSIQYIASGVLSNQVQAVFSSDGCSVTDTCILQGIPGDALVEYTLSSVEAPANSLINVDITTRRFINIAQPETRTIQAVLSFNATLLMPTDGTPLGTVTNGIRSVPLTLDVKSPNTIISRLKFKTMLGTDTTTMFDLQQASGSDVVVTSSSGKYTITPVCNEGGTRLFNPYAEKAVMYIAPQPVGSTADLFVRTIESGMLRLTLNDGLGRVVTTILERETDAGEYNMPLDLTSIPNGVYWLHLSTPTMIQTIMLQVLR